jgi:hypothetical protein
MYLSTSTFQFVRCVRFERAHYPHSIEHPHPPRVFNKQTRHYMARLAESVRFVSKHCPMLQSLHVEPLEYYWQLQDTTPVQALAPLVLALKHLVGCCNSLQVVGAISRVVVVTTSKDGSIISSSDPMSRSTHDIDLRLEGVKMHTRADVVERWCRTTLRECVECTGSVQFVSLDYLDASAAREQHPNLWCPFSVLQSICVVVEFCLRDRDYGSRQSSRPD